MVNYITTKHFSFHKSLIFALKFLPSWSSEDTNAQIHQELTLSRKRRTPLVEFTLALLGLVSSILLTVIRERRMGFETLEVHSTSALKSGNSTMDLSQYLTIS